MKNISLFLFSFLLLEIILRGFGSGYFMLRDALQDKGDGVPVILCLGESTTAFGLGKSYPSQLQSRLNEIYKKGAYRVVNAGKPGITTNQILQDLPALLAQHRPWLVISMLGINDQYSRMESEVWYTELRLYRVFRWAWLYFTHREILQFGTEPDDYEEIIPADLFPSLEYSAVANRDFVIAEKNYTALEKSRPLSAFETWQMARSKYYNDKVAEGRLYLDQFATVSGETARAHLLAAWFDYNQGDLGNSEFVTRHIEQALLKDPDDLKVNWMAGVFYRNTQEFEKSEKFFLHALKLNHCDSRTVYGLWKLYRQLNKTPEAIALNNECKDSLATRGLIDPNTAHTMVRANFMENETFKINYRKIAELIFESGAKHAVMQYPLNNPDPLKKILAGIPAITYISNLQEFSRQQETRPYDDLFSDNFAGNFGHATPLGNSIIADQVVKTLQSSRIIP